MTEVLALTQPGEALEMDVDDDGFIEVNVVTPPPIVEEQKAPEQPADALERFENGDPFADSDLPVEL